MDEFDLALKGGTTPAPAPVRETPDSARVVGDEFDAALRGIPNAAGSRVESLPVGSIPFESAPSGNFVEDAAQDIFEGATAPFTGAWEAAMGLLADPAIRVLPVSTQDEHLKRAEELGWKGAAFWGSMLAGGGAAALGKSFLAKSVLGGAAGLGSQKLIEVTPDVVHQDLSLEDAAKEIGTATALGSLFGGAVGSIPGAAKVVGKMGVGTGRFANSAANKILDVTPGGPQLREGTTRFIRDHFAANWDKYFTSGQELLRKVGAAGLATQLRMSSSLSALVGGRWNADFSKNVGWIGNIRLPGALTPEEIRQMSFLMIGRNMHEIAPGTPVSGFSQRVVDASIAEARRLRSVGLRLQRAGVKVFDPESGESHTFLAREDYGIPIRYNNPDFYRAGGEYRDASLAKLTHHGKMTRERAEEWLDSFADRLQSEQDGILTGGPISGGTSHFMMGRSLALPGYETDLRDILPQYYEYAARRLSNHLIFGPVSSVENATRKAVQEQLFAPDDVANAASKVDPQAEQLFIDGLREWKGRGIPKEPIQRKLTVGQVVHQRQAQAEKELRRAFAVEHRYPRAFAQLEAITNDPARKKLAEAIVRRQLGAIDKPTHIEGLWRAFAKAEVVSKLALGAIAQPSQVLSAVVRTQYKGSMKNLFKSLGNDPEALDFALRSGVILRGVVRHAEQSLTGGQAEFLEKVGFTQMDMKSRIFGALQGASFAENQAAKLYSLVRRGDKASLARAAKIEQRLASLGLDTRGIVQRGGHLSESELLKAGQKVSSDVNFWGDQLSLPEFYRSPAGRYLTMFKSFGHQQGQLFKNTIAKPAAEWLATDGKKGDIGPFLRFATLTPIGGEIIADVKRMARAKDPRRTDKNIAERILENISMAAGFGMTWDALEAAKYGTAGVLGWGVGPIGSEIGKGGANLRAAATGKPEKLAKQIIEFGIPVAANQVAPGIAPLVAAGAPAVSNILIPPEKK